MAYGYAKDFLGMYLYFRDNHESGSYVSIRNDLTPLQGQIVSDGHKRLGSISISTTVR